MKRTSVVFIALFLIISLVPSLGITVWGSSQAAANEILSPVPKVTDSGGNFNTDYLNQLSDRFADTFALRQEFISIWSAFNAKLLSTSVEPQVTLGKDSWLFYTSTLDDYTGQLLSDREIFMAANNLALMQEYAESCGARFVFTIAPNKNSVYPQYMPSSIEHGGKSSSSLLTQQLDSLSVNYADMFEAFNRDEVLYFITDSHWNSRGAALAADTLMERLGRESSYFNADFIGFTEHKGDLYEMLYPAGKFTEADPIYPYKLDYSCLNDPNGGNAISIETASNGKGKLICWRDSFGISLYPYLAENFEAVMFSRSTTYDLCQIPANEYDYVIIELVERNIEWLIAKAPVLPAPAREITLSDTEGECCSVKFGPGKSQTTEELSCLTASIPYD